MRPRHIELLYLKWLRRYNYPARVFAQRRLDGRTLRWAAIRIPLPNGRERYARTCASLTGCHRIINSLKTERRHV